MVNALIRTDPTVLSTIVRLAPEIANDSSLLAAVFDGARRSDGLEDRGAIRVVLRTVESERIDGAGAGRSAAVGCWSGPG